ncbi:MAG: type I-E CRISPR-associated protein Cas6/Cse3/CasE [Pseudomonadota bacterium]
MTLHLVELPIDLACLHRWAGQRGLGARGALDEGAALHHLLGEAFGPSMLQPFRLLVAPRARRGTLYAYAEAPAEALADTARGVAGPSEREVLPLDRIRAVERPDGTWREGMRLGFDLRARPVIRLASPLQGDGARFAKGAEIDAFLAETLRNDAARPREAVYRDWLAERLEPVAGLESEETRLHAFRRARVRRNGRWLDGPDAILHGTLIIRDPQAFADLLAQGVGRHRAYGYGMLLLRPPQRS